MPLKISKFTGPGSTPSRRRFWDSVVDLVSSEEKLPGDNVVVTEYDGYGSLIDVVPQRARNQPSGETGACCHDDGTCDDLTETDCTDAGGNWQGPGTNCEDTPCTGACCNDGVCTPDMTKADCEGGGGTFQDFGSECSPNPCVVCSDTVTLCKCGVPAFEGFGSSAWYLHREFHITRTEDNSSPDCHTTWDFTTTNIYTVESDGSCSVACECSGGGTSSEGDPTFSWVPGGVGVCGDNNAGGCHGSGMGTPHACNPTCVTGDTGGPVSATLSTQTCIFTLGGYSVTFQEDITLSNEYTTAMLIANTIAAFEASCHCPEGFVVTYELNEDESCCTASCVPE